MVPTCFEFDQIAHNFANYKLELELELIVESSFCFKIVVGM